MFKDCQLEVLGMEPNKKVVNTINRLRGNKLAFQKYQRNMRLYCYSPTADLNNPDSCIGYYQLGTYGDDTTSSIQENVIYSVISALVSKIASQKARPFINTVKGTYKDVNIAKSAQQYFDIMFDEQNIYRTITEVFRDACIFSRGWLYIDKENHSVSKCNPWQVFTDPYEEQYGLRNTIVWERKKFPVVALEEKTEETTKLDCTYIKYWNLKDNKEVTYIPELKYYEEKDWSEKELPFLDIWYEKPVSGNSSQSIVDMLYGIQMEVDSLNEKIKEASQLNPANTIFMPEQSSIKASKLNNKVGQVVTYTATPNMTGSPVTVATPAIIDKSYTSLLNMYKQDAYELVGLTELSATGQKPAGLDSGLALSTLENIESDRFQTQLNNVLRLYVDIARRCIELFDGQVLPNIRHRLDISWGDIKRIKNKMSIQFSAADSLSKDPSTKLQQLQKLAQAGLLPANRIASLMEMPDLEQGYSFAANSLNAVQTVITDCIENNNYDIPPYISLEELKPEILNTCLMLKSMGKDNEPDIKKLEKLYDTIMNTETELGQAGQVDEANAALDAEANSMDYDTMMMDAQTQQMTSIANDLQNGIIDVDQANSMLAQMQNIDFGIGIE